MISAGKEHQDHYESSRFPLDMDSRKAVNAFPLQGFMARYFLITIFICLFWIIMDLLFFPSMTPLPAVLTGILAITYTLQKQGWVQIAWHWALISVALLITFFPLLFFPLPSFTPGLILVFHLATVGFESRTLNLRYGIFLGACLLLNVSFLIYIPPPELGDNFLFFANLTTAATVIVLAIVANNIQLKVLFRLREEAQGHQLSLQESEKKYRTLFNASPYGIMLVNIQERELIEYNQRMLEIFACGESDLQERLKAAFLPPKENHEEGAAAKLRALLDDYEQHPRPISFQWQYVRKNGEVFDADVSIRPKTLDQRKVSLIHIRDITEKMIVQHALENVASASVIEDEQHFFNTLTISLSHILQVPIAFIGRLDPSQKRIQCKAVWFFDHIIKDHEYVLANTPCERVLTDTKAKHFPENIQRLFPDDYDLQEWNVESYLGVPLMNSRQQPIGIIAIMDTGPLRHPQTAPAVLRIYANRVANELERNENLRALETSNQELRKANDELDQFVYSAAHDIRSPISSVMGLLNISQQEENLETLRKYQQLQRHSLEKLDQFIKDLISYSINNRSEVKTEAVRLEGFLDEIREQYRFRPMADRLEIRMDLQAVPVVHTDPSRLRIIFNNLISNAISYQDPQKPASWLEIRAWPEADQIKFKVRDNGLGIPEERQGKIFDMFYRGNSSSQGSGIGLYITKEAVQKLDGEIRVTSEPGQGSCFYFSIANQEVPQRSLDKSS
jgi:PAS domain S-box-containing protein